MSTLPVASWQSPRAKGSHDAELLARVAWSRLAEPGEHEAAELVATHGHQEALVRVRQGAHGSKYAARLADLDPERDLDVAARVNASVITPESPHWPSGLGDLGAPPHCLWVRGDPSHLACLARSGVAVVGARANSPYGAQLAMALGFDLTERGLVVVSGAAFGIDAEAHRGALQAGGPTIAVLAGGIDRPYPVSHTSLIDAIADSGCVVTECAPGSSAMRQRFLSRNRLIAAMTVGTVVVEAGLRSGSLNTARTAESLSRVVAAVPGPVTSMVSAGCHEAIRAGYAVLVTDAADVIEVMTPMGLHLVPVRRGPSRPLDDVDPREQAVWGAMPSMRSISVQALAAAAGLALQDVLVSLGRLERAGLVSGDGAGGWRRRAR